MQTTLQATTPQAAFQSSISGPKVPAAGFIPGASEARRQGLLKRHAKVAQWATLNLRQDWADEAFLRGHLRVAGIRIASDLEPATVTRLRSLLAAAGVGMVEARTSVMGDPKHSLDEYLDLNPRLPLWAAVALVLEATGRFNPQVSDSNSCTTPGTQQSLDLSTPAGGWQ